MVWVNLGGFFGERETKRMRLRKLWIWSAEEAQFYKAFISGTCLHVCCGISTIGDVRVDRYNPGLLRGCGGPSVIADYRALPFGDESFDTTLCDPPWAKSEALDKGLASWLYELARVTKRRLIIIHHTIFAVRDFNIVDAWALNNQARGLLWKVVQIHDRCPKIN